MKQSPSLVRAQGRMRPGVLTRDGFLGEDARPLADILEADAVAVARLGLTHAQIARHLRELRDAVRDAGRQGMGLAVKVAPHFEVRVDSVRGRLPCPFGEQGLFQKMNTTVVNLRTGGEITYTDLGIHMIDAHGFYEGAGAPFRLDPAALRDVLELAPEPPAEP
jgi:hypothetical protein